MKITSLDLPSLDEANALGKVQAELPEAVEVTEICQGLKFWRNPINHFAVAMLHRTADPEKRSEEWVKKTRSGLATSDWLREYELKWESLEGRPVYQDEFSYEFHVAKSALGWNPTLMICRGWDFGLYPACIFVQLFPHSRLMVLREAVGEDIDSERFIYEVSRLSNEWFPGGQFIEFIDPTGRNRVGTDGRTYSSLLTKKPLRARKIIPGANAPAARRTGVIDFLKDNVRGMSCLLIDPSCETLIKGFGGGYMYAYHKGTLKTKPEKNIFSHIHDGLQYACSKIRTANLSLSTRTIQIIEPRFGKGEAPIALGA